MIAREHIGQRPRLLIVDDSKLIRQVVYDFFMKVGYRVDEADDGNSAMHYLETSSPDIIVADILMPGMDGWRLFEEVRKRNDTADTPFIFLTTEKELPKRLRGFRIGADDYVTKPFEVEELHARVERTLAQRRLLEQARAGDGAMLSGSSEHLALTDLAQILSMNGKDAAVEVRAANTRGSVRFRRGEIVHAETGGVTGLKALYRILGWERARFMVTDSGEDRGESSISGKTSNILMDAMVALDDWKRYRTLIPAPGVKLMLAPDAKEKVGGRKVSVVEFEIMARIRIGGSTSQILDGSKAPDAVVAEAICNLIKLGVISTTATG